MRLSNPRGDTLSSLLSLTPCRRWVREGVSLFRHGHLKSNYLLWTIPKHSADRHQSSHTRGACGSSKGSELSVYLQRLLRSDLFQSAASRTLTNLLPAALQHLVPHLQDINSYVFTRSSWWYAQESVLCLFYLPIGWMVGTVSTARRQSPRPMGKRLSCECGWTGNSLGFAPPNLPTDLRTNKQKLVWGAMFNKSWSLLPQGSSYKWWEWPSLSPSR